MATKVIMPKAGMAMEEGIVVAWLKKAGDAIAIGEPIAEIETDKAVMELEAEVAGSLLAIVRGAGEHVAVTEVIAWIGAPGEPVPASVGGTGTGTGTPKAPVAGEGPGKAAAKVTEAAPAAEYPFGKPATPAARRVAAEAGVDIESLSVPAGGAIHAGDVSRHIRKDATPLASRIAQAAGIDPSTLPHPEGARARKADAEAAVGSAVGSRVEDRHVPFTNIQRITGERLARSHAEIPAVTVFAVADATGFLKVREEVNAAGDLKISVNDLALRACAKALAANPRANAVLDGKGLLLKGGINIGIAVATDSGLLVPTLRDADRLPLAELSRRARDLAERARAHRLRPDELDGGTFTITNIGMYGVTSFTPIINQPQVGILGIGAIEDRLALDAAGLPVARKALHLSFTFDHRALDGAEASSFIKAVKDLVEAPLLILV
jgi:pyruvate dehydrogenase E2 component (dihydrolipoamide acetyltransferase)